MSTDNKKKQVPPNDEETKKQQDLELQDPPEEPLNAVIIKTKDGKKWLFKDLVKELVKQELDEFNAMGTGAVAGYQQPLGTDTKQIHKGFWREQPDPEHSKEPKTGSPRLHGKK